MEHAVYAVSPPARPKKSKKNADDAFIASSAQALPYWLSLVVAVDGDGKALPTGCRKSPLRGGPPDHVGAPNHMRAPNHVGGVCGTGSPDYVGGADRVQLQRNSSIAAVESCRGRCGRAHRHARVEISRPDIHLAGADREWIAILRVSGGDTSRGIGNGDGHGKWEAAPGIPH